MMSSKARLWWDGLEPDLRTVILRDVICLAREPSDAQIVEATDLVDQPGIMEGITDPSMRVRVREAIAKLR